MTGHPTSERPQPLIVGAGPAGIRAAEALVAAGLRPLVVDEAPACGGQIYRQRLAPDGRSSRDLYGSEAAKAETLHRDFAALDGKLDYWPQALLWNLRDGRADIMIEGTSRQVAYDGLLLATGATDRTLPLPGWTLPGVFTLGGAQIALKSQGCAIGSKVVFLGSGPLLYLVAWQYMKAGAKVAAVLDTAPFAAKFNLLRGLPLFPGIVLRGMRMTAELKLAGIALHYGVGDVRIEGASKVEAIAWRQDGLEHRLTCDGIGYGLALRSETQLADLAGCRFAFNARDRAVLPERDAAGRTSVPGVYLAGDGAGIAGADAAERAGERVALALLQDRGLPHDAARAAALEAELARISRFREVLEAAFPFPAHWVRDIADATTLCRCEEITAGEVRAAINRFGVHELNRLKAVSRVGMGRCQGRICAAAAAELLAHEAGRGIEAVGRLRSQAPVKPVPLTLALTAQQEAAE
ncbi:MULTISPECIES: NAD(P)/FAD-dependent oxidoreductase [unclassified Bosea (in: a-proteobacteria)]|uniref:FAD/NAD(P)-dependent oxidoreductase n=1 Tax=unclassified Bosea (in: a-proteobacteria) TaxID=2653178 RepID=UPI000F761378|nr:MULTISPECIES: NAD(P)/FAD-dependent oxidoreductase [unclassified Bosea (in: a-proteobacteria)]AZO80308.1 FAD/NAD(P)-binding oxidoreductase [Bosea sp. Tri-49]RXT23106.1 FAD/NAD(P)-binding oxidoreductase [Bosea sp. Tri-39]RXT38577.1 FAD/NAD(P)-binding oxidoreductase [Bosea sp. Tri-54]